MSRSGADRIGAFLDKPKVDRFMDAATMWWMVLAVLFVAVVVGFLIVGGILAPGELSVSLPGLSDDRRAAAHDATFRGPRRRASSVRRMLSPPSENGATATRSR